MRTDAGLPEPERRLVQAARTGALVDLSSGEPDIDAIASASGWGANRMVRAEFLAELLEGVRSSHDGRLRRVRLRGALITGQLDLEAASLMCSVLLQNCYFEEMVILRDAQASALRLHGCWVPRIEARHLRTRGSLEFCAGSTAQNGIDLNGAHVGGSLSLEGANLASCDGRGALSAQRIIVDGNVLCRYGFSAHDKVDLLGAHIKGSLDFSAARLTSSNGPALDAARMRVDSAVFLREGFICEGEFSIRNSHLGSFVDFADASLSNPGGIALLATGIIVERSVVFGKGFNASGRVVLFGTTAVRIEINGGHFDNPEGCAINLGHASATSLLLAPDEPPNGTVDLTGARVDNFRDDPDVWPARLRLRGFAYGNLENDSVGVQSRLRWLSLHGEGYVPANYDQLAVAYRRAGRVEASRVVSIAKQKHRRRELNPFGKIWNWLLQVTVGYGYRTWYAGLWLLGLLTVGSIVFSVAYPEDMSPAADVVPSFQPVAYTVDILVSLVDLGQKKTWIPKGSAMVWSWMLTSSGWLLTTAVVAGLTNALKRD